MFCNKNGLCYPNGATQLVDKFFVEHQRILVESGLILFKFGLPSPLKSTHQSFWGVTYRQAKRQPSMGHTCKSTQNYRLYQLQLSLCLSTACRNRKFHIHHSKCYFYIKLLAKPFKYHIYQLDVKQVKMKWFTVQFNNDSLWLVVLCS